MKYITKDLANSIGVSTNTIRRYEEYGFLSPSKTENSYREFDYFDAHKAAQVRLYGKYGFTNDEIAQMIDKNDDELAQLYNQKVDAIKKEISDLESHVNWLKNNLEFLNSTSNPEGSFYIKKNIPLRYIPFREEMKQLDSPDLNKAIKDFTYDTPEVHLVNIGMRNPANPFEITQYMAWAVKECNIDKFGLRDLVNNCPYIKEYPEQECIFTISHIPSEICNDIDAVLGSLMPNWNKVLKYLSENGYEPTGDILQYYINIIGNPITTLDCQPIRKITS